MFLTLTTTRAPATDLGWLLHKHPDHVRSVSLTFGRAHVFWPEAGEDRATVAMLVEVDPIGLVRGRHAADDGPLAAYVNDRPYVTSSFLSVALGQVFRSAVKGDCQRPELLGEPWPLRVELHVVRAKGGEGLIGRLFEPLGYEVDAVRLPRDEVVELGESALYRVTLSATTTVSLLLRHLLVLLPVLDDEKHYWVGQDEVDKLLDRGEGWLASHPEQQLVTERYLKHRRSLARAALERLAEGTEAEEEADEAADAPSTPERALEKPLKLNDVRMARVVELLRQPGVARVVDLGCGEGKLLRRLAGLSQLTEVVGVDASSRALEVAERRLERTPGREKVRLLTGSVTYRDDRLDGFDAAAAVEVIEHLEPHGVRAFTQAVLGGARPRLLVVTTPNAEYNVRFPDLPAGAFRHADHRFEWTRAQFAAWATDAAERWGYDVSFEDVGEVDPEVGAPTQLAVFRCR
ncbi:MAG: 3' terminal RNA ribose 2'-O-methyltransferase Hen1 [Alphaproteobacteria bacterium]|nr:3' terminal RNA ribose 2'-O-methyltransferase Hen1 [Alphaproteobacteria bacterium]MCB9695193.1 3' terminal RNA ribose 2'-O-methyltransferase Hen1 [Alphaproteobacteria bacterium]